MQKHEVELGTYIFLNLMFGGKMKKKRKNRLRVTFSSKQIIFSSTLDQWCQIPLQYNFVGMYLYIRLTYVPK